MYMAVCCVRGEGRQETRKKKKKKVVGSFKKNPSHLDFESGADIGSDVVYGDMQKELQVGLLLWGTANISKLFYGV